MKMSTTSASRKVPLWASTAAILIALSGPTLADDTEVSEPLPVAGYENGFFIQDPGGGFRLVVGATAQPLFAWKSEEAHTEDIDGVTGDTVVLGRTDREPEYAFLIRRARLKLKGHAFSPRVTYCFMADFARGSTILHDYHLDFALAPGVLHMRLGSYKRPFSREQVTSSGRLELVDRSIANKAFGQGRDLGLMFHNGYEKSPIFEWALGVFNGTGEKPWFEGALEEDDAGEIAGISSKSKFDNIPDRFHPMVVARIGYNRGKLKGYSEADLEGGPLRFGTGLSGIVDFDSDGGSDSNIRGELDFILKAAGFSLTCAAYVMSSQDGDDFSSQAYASWGLNVQTGYVIKGMVQPVLRYALVDLEGDDNNVQEITGGLSVYVFGHNLKWQVDGGGILREHEAGDLVDHLVRTQVTLSF